MANVKIKVYDATTNNYFEEEVEETIQQHENHLEQLMKYDVMSVLNENNVNKFSIPYDLTKLHEKQIILVETPEVLEYATSNTLNGIIISSILLPNIKYELTYEKGKFEINNGMYYATIGTEWNNGVQIVELNGIKSKDVPVVDVLLSDDTTTAKAEIEAWNCISKIETATDSIILTCFDEVPTIEFSIQLKVAK